MRFRFLAIVPILAAPSVALAAPNTLKALADLVTNLLGAATVLAIGLGVLLYFWGILSNMMELQEGKNVREFFQENVGWGLLALFAMISIWGLVQLLQNTFLAS